MSCNSLRCAISANIGEICDDWEVCEDGECVLPPTPAPVDPPSIECRSDSDCFGPYGCQFGRCTYGYNSPTPKPTPRPPAYGSRSSSKSGSYSSRSSGSYSSRRSSSGSYSSSGTSRDKNSRRRSSSSRIPPPPSNKIHALAQERASGEDSRSSSKEEDLTGPLEVEHDKAFNAFAVGHLAEIYSSLNTTMNVFLAAASLITILFALRQVFLHCTNSKNEWIELKDPQIELTKELI